MNPGLLSVTHSDPCIVKHYSLWNLSYIFSIIFLYKIFLSLKRLSPKEQQLNCRFLNLFSHLLRTIPWIFTVQQILVDRLRGLVQPLKQVERIIHKVWASPSQLYFFPMLTATDVNKEFGHERWVSHLNLTSVIIQAGTCHSSLIRLLFSII